MVSLEARVGSSQPDIDGAGPGHAAGAPATTESGGLAPATASGTAAQGRWWSVWVSGGGIFLVRLGAALAVALCATHLFGPPSTFALGVAAGSTSLTSSLLHWDAIQYLAIAEHGYNHPYLEAYFPVFPLLIRVVHGVTGLSDNDSSLLVAWAATALLCVAAVYLCRRVLGLERWARPVSLLLFAPASFFFFAGYPESIEALLFVALMILLAQNRLVLAALVAGVASGTAQLGVFFVIAVLVRLLQLQLQLRTGGGVGAGHRRDQRLALVVKAVVLGVVSVLGLIAFSLYLWAEVHHPFAYVSAEKLWNRKLTWPFHGLVWSVWNIAHGGHALYTEARRWNWIVTYSIDDLVTVAAVVAAIVVIVWVVRARAWREAVVGPVVCALAALVFNICDGSAGGVTPEALARHLLVLVPLYLAACRVRSPEVAASLLAGSAVVGTVAAAMFSFGIWFT